MAKRGANKKIVVVDSSSIMPGDFKDEMIAFTGLRRKLRQYLELDTLPRLTQTNGWKSDRAFPSSDAMERMSESEQTEWVARKLQMDIDKLLRRVLVGEDARTVFQLDRKISGQRQDACKTQAMCSEVGRLMADYKLSRPAAIDEVAGFYEVDTKTVERALERWDLPSDVEGYTRRLKLAGIL